MNRELNGIKIEDLIKYEYSPFNTCLFLLPQGLPPRPKTPGFIAPVSKPAPPTNPAPSKPPETSCVSGPSLSNPRL